MGLKGFLAIASAAFLQAGGAALAADMSGMLFDPPEVAMPRMEHGTGWYLRGSISATREMSPALSADVAMDTIKNGSSAELGFGYSFNNWFRADVTAGWQRGRSVIGTGDKVTCPYALTGLSSQGANVIELGYLWDAQKETCTPTQNAKVSQSYFLLNGYLDLGPWSSVTPYIGAGVGVSTIRGETKLDYYKTSDGSLYGADLTPSGTFPHIWVDLFGNPIAPQPSVSFAKQVWSRSLSKMQANLAWALMGGFALNVSDNFKIDIGYRYMSLGSWTSLPSPVTGLTKTTRLNSQEVRFGFRYMID